MAHLVEGMTYIFRFTKRDGSPRTMLATIVSIPLGSNHLYVEELLGDGKKEYKTIRRDSDLKAVRANVSILASETASETIVTHSASEHTLEEQKPVEALKTPTTKAKYSIKKVGNKYDVMLGQRVLGTCYSVAQVEKLVSYHMNYNF